jgi:predicted alpha/beta-fold hydrolase
MKIDSYCRRFTGMAFAALVATLPSSFLARADAAPTPNPAATIVNIDPSFGALKQIDAGVLNVGYVEAGPPNGPAVLLLHGWPYDIHSFAEVTPMLAAAGYHVIVPHLRGYGSTRFLSSSTMRNGQPSALAQDVIDLMDALKILQAIIAGFDWGARSADIVAALWPSAARGSSR